MDATDYRSPVGASAIGISRPVGMPGSGISGCR